MNTKIRYSWIFFPVLALTSLLSFSSFSQSPQQKPLRQTALENFRAGLYEQAYRDYSALLQNYPRDPQYKYYSGVSLINLKKDPAKAMSLLQEAVDGSLDIKAIPDDAWFYLGRSQQMSGRYNEAVRSYGHFSDIAGRKAAREFKVSELIQECREGKGQINDTEPLIADTVMDNGDTLSPAGQDKPQERPEPEPALTPAAKPIPVKEKLPAEYDRDLTQALDYQVKADSLMALAAEIRPEYERVPSSRKPAVKARIDELESEAGRYQRLADEKFGSTGLRTLPEKARETIPSVQVPVEKTAQDSAPKETGLTRKAETIPERAPASGDAKPVFSLFDIAADQKSISTQKIAIDPVMPEGLIYRIQIAVFSKPATSSIFRGITPVSGFKVPGSEAVKYYAGMFRKSEDANKALLRVKQSGFRDAFLNAVLDGKIVSIDRALLLEKEWGNKPLFQNVVKADAETGPATLSYRVEVFRSPKPVKDEITESYKKLAGAKGLEILTSEDGSLVYLIGKFITFDSASEYANLLVRNGYREARVSAYLGDKEIPVESAEKLFDRLK